jgi:phosphoglycolate phosphatase-like HAD superfamily hydrolase
VKGQEFYLDNYPRTTIKRRVVIWDLDGTLCDTGWRDHHAKARRWDEFHAGLHLDQPFPHMLFLLRALNGSNAHLLFITARPFRYYEATDQWIQNVTHLGRSGYTLLMRADGDLRRASVVKGELLDKYLESRPDDELLFALEDHAPVVAMWRSRGIPCFHVTDARD